MNSFSTNPPPKNIPVLVYSRKEGYVIAENKGYIMPSMRTKPFGKSIYVDVEDVEGWWELPEVGK